MSAFDLSQYRSAVVDSRVALDHARADGLPMDAELYTTAPGLMLSDDLSGIRPLVGGDEDRRAFSESLAPLAERLFGDLGSAGVDRPKAVLVVRQFVLLHRVQLAALGVRGLVMAEPVVRINVEASQPALTQNLNIPITDYLKTETEVDEVAYDVPITKTTDAARPSLIDWLRVTNRFDLGYRFLRYWWRKRQPAPDRCRAIIIRENELVGETAYALAKRGFAILHRPMPSSVTEPDLEHEEEIETKLAIVSPAITEHVTAWFGEQAVAPALATFRALLSLALTQYHRALEHWKAVLDEVADPGRTAVLCNYPGLPALIALAEYCRGRKVPFVGFQHGVTREICRTHDQYTINYENNLTDLFLTFNEQAAEFSRKSPFGSAPVISVGMPEQYRSLARRSLATHQPILYVSTCLYSGNVNLFNGWLSDIGRAEREVAMVDQVLAHLPHRVLFKTYPSKNRYTDRDAVLDALDRASNIDVYDQAVNLRNLVAKHRVVVTSRATSTLSVCLMSNRPVVYIDMPDHAPMRDEAAALVKQGCFYFDYADPGVLKALRDFLSQPISDIERQWRDKASARKALIRDYFDGPGVGAGERAADEIECLINAGGGS